MKLLNPILVILMISILLISCKEGTTVSQVMHSSPTSTVSVTMIAATIQIPTRTTTATFIPTNTHTLTPTITPFPAEMGAMGISFDGEFYHGDMPDGGEFSAVMVENESGVGLVDKGNHFLAAAQDENGQWEWVGLNIGRMVTTAEAESAQTISLEQVWDGSYARWCDLMFGVENRTTSKDLSPQYKPKEKYNLVSLTKYGDEGDVFEVKDVKQLGGSPGVWIFHVRAGLGNGFVESMNLIGPTNDLTNLNEMVRLRQGTFSMLLEVKSTTQGTDALFTELMLDYMDKQVLVTGLDIDSLFRDVRSITHGSLKSVVIPVADVHVPQN